METSPLGVQTNNAIRHRLRVFLLGICGFIILTSLAMLVFPGGYSFTRNSFSDLGATRSSNGTLNLPCMILFAGAMTSWAGSYVYFLKTWHLIERRQNINSRFQRVIRPFGTISALSFIGIALIPVNVSTGLHVIFIDFAFGFLLLYVMSSAILQSLYKWPAKSLIVSLVYLGLLIIYCKGLYKGPMLSMFSPAETNAISQKVIVYLSMAVVGTQAFPATQIRENAPVVETSIVA